MTGILVIEDDRDLAFGLRLLLERGGHHVEHAPDGPTGLRMLFRVRPDLILLDLGLPGLDGWQVLTRIRDLTDAPVLVLSGYGQERDKVRAFHGGADDYVLKPFTNVELLARVGALLRRVQEPAWTTEIYDDGRLQVDPARRTVIADGRPVTLSTLEFRLLHTLVRQNGILLTPRQLLDRVWDDPTGLGTERVKFTALRLRRQLGWPDPKTSPIQAVRGLGYRYQPPTQIPLQREAQLHSIG